MFELHRLSLVVFITYLVLIDLDLLEGALTEFQQSARKSGGGGGGVGVG